MRNARRTLVMCLALVAGTATLAGRAAGQVTTLVSCAAGTGVGDPITRAFYVTNFPGVNLGDVTLRFSANAAGRYILTLTPRLNRFDGPVLGSASAAVVLNGSPGSFVSATFSFSFIPIAKGSTVAFVISRQGSGPETLLFDKNPSGACSIVETNDTTPPLSTVRGSVTATITGDAAPPTALTNGSFDTNIGGWIAISAQGSTGTVTFDTSDANGSAASGSALITNSSSSASSIYALGTCVTPTHGGSYTFGGKARYPSGQSAQSGPFVGVVGFSGLGCTGTGSPGPPLALTPVATNNGAWQNLSAILTLPVNTGWTSLLFFASVYKVEAGGTISASFDDLFFRSAHLATRTTLANASIHGQAGSFFHTDLWVLNHSFHETITVNATFRCFAGKDCGTPNQSFSLAPRQQRLFADVLSSLFGASETAGAIELTYDGFLTDISASARTYSPNLPNPTTGTGISALPSTDTHARAVFTAIAGNGGDLSSGFRTNAGMYNPSGSSTSVTLTLYDSSGAVIGSPVTRTFAALEAFQFNDIFAAVGAGGTVARDATLVVTSDVPIWSYVTVVDNQTNDTTLIYPTDDVYGP